MEGSLKVRLMMRVQVMACLFPDSQRTPSCLCQWLRLLEEMADAGLKPNVETYNAAIKAYGKGRQLKEALR